MVFFREVLPNPVGEDTSGEWIKLVNTESSAVDLRGWSIKDASGKTYLLNTSINGKTELLLEYSVTGITLNNTNETLILTSSANEVVDSLLYTQAGDDEIIIGDHFVEKTTTQADGVPTLNELAISGNKTLMSDGEAPAIIVALALAIMCGLAVGIFIKKKQEK